VQQIRRQFEAPEPTPAANLTSEYFGYVQRFELLTFLESSIDSSFFLLTKKLESVTAELASTNEELKEVVSKASSDSAAGAMTINDLTIKLKALTERLERREKELVTRDKEVEEAVANQAAALEAADLVERQLRKLECVMAELKTHEKEAMAKARDECATMASTSIDLATKLDALTTDLATRDEELKKALSKASSDSAAAALREADLTTKLDALTTDLATRDEELKEAMSKASSDSAAAAWREANLTTKLDALTTDLATRDEELKKALSKASSDSAAAAFAIFDLTAKLESVTAAFQSLISRESNNPVPPAPIQENAFILYSSSACNQKTINVERVGRLLPHPPALSSKHRPRLMRNVAERNRHQAPAQRSTSAAEELIESVGASVACDDTSALPTTAPPAMGMAPCPQTSRIPRMLWKTVLTLSVTAGLGLGIVFVTRDGRLRKRIGTHGVIWNHMDPFPRFSVPSSSSPSSETIHKIGTIHEIGTKHLVGMVNTVCFWFFPL